MKRLLLLIVVFTGLFFVQTEAKNRYGGVTFNYFYGSLSPYGQWIEIDHDLYAWRPYNVRRSWQPYTVGRWVWTNNGWYWDSYEPFGWATYHYGRWHFDDYYGWIWLPDYDWAPAWVEWRYDNDFIGWAPLPPYAEFRPGFGIRFSIDFHFPVSCWTYISYRHFDGYDVHRYIVSEKVKYRVHGKSKYRYDYDYRDGRIINRGIDRDIIERRGGYKVRERDMFETGRMRNNGERNRDKNRVEVFRPDNNEIGRFRETRIADVKKAERRPSLELSRLQVRDASGKEFKERDRNEKNKNDRNFDNPSGRNNDVNVNRTERNQQVEKNRQAERNNREAEMKRNEERRIQERKIEERRAEEKRTEERRMEERRQQYSQPQVRERNNNGGNSGSERRSVERRTEQKQPSRTIERPSNESSRESGARGNESRESRGNGGKTKDRR